MARRILTAREQHEMLSPWRLAAADPVVPKKIYRGIRLTNLPPELHQRIDDLQQLPMHEGEVGQHLKIGPMLLDHLHNTPWKPFSQTPDHLQYTGLGRHWSRRKEFAELAASNQVGPGMSVVLEADDPGEQYYDPDRPMTGGYGPDDPHEQENTLLPNTPLNITSIRLPRKPFEEVLDDPYYHNMEQEYGHPYPGGPRPGVGGVAVDPFSQKKAAVNQDLVDRLHGEFKDWRKQQPRGSIFGGGIIGGIDHWPNIEMFLKDNYPAAHRGLEMGHEQAGLLMDGIPPSMIEGNNPDISSQYSVGASFDPYETGPEAEAQYGYDPKEIAAAMLLLHNKSDRFRGDMSHEDQARLNDIAQKRYQMQRDYEQRQTTASTVDGDYAHLPRDEHGRTVTAMPRADAYTGIPEGYTFNISPKSGYATLDPHGSGGWASRLLWWSDGEVQKIDTLPDHQHKGLATFLFNETKKHVPHLHHSEDLTPAGRGWAKSMYDWDPEPEDDTASWMDEEDDDGYSGPSDEEIAQHEEFARQHDAAREAHWLDFINRQRRAQGKDELATIPEEWRADLGLRTAALSEDEGQKMREVYAPHDPANPPEHLKPHLMLPIGAAHHYREYDRPYDDVLGQVIADQGIRQPLRISTDGTHATMHEGNHRLEIAKRLGLTHVPVQVTLEKPGEVINNGGRPPAPLESHLGDWVDQNRHRLKSFWKG